MFVLARVACNCKGFQSFPKLGKAAGGGQAWTVAGKLFFLVRGKLCLRGDT